MSNGKTKQNNKNKAPPKPQPKTLPKIIVVVVGVVLVFTALYIGGYIPHFHSDSKVTSNFTAPTTINWGTFTQISNQNFAGSGQENIYFVSWIGCPIGASLSWALNYTFSHYQGVTNVKTEGHYSDPNEAGDAASLPGLLFMDAFSYNQNGIKVSFFPVYMYNETLFGYASNNTPIESSNLVSAGLSVVNSSVPSGISSLVYKYTNLVGVSISPYKPSAFLSTPNHMNTVLVITGSFGTYMLNGPIYSPTDLHGTSYQSLENAQNNGFSGYPYIVSAASEINNIITK
jgi:hypothetical protein